MVNGKDADTCTHAVLGPWPHSYFGRTTMFALLLLSLAFSSFMRMQNLCNMPSFKVPTLPLPWSVVCACGHGHDRGRGRGRLSKGMWRDQSSSTMASPFR